MNNRVLRVARVILVTLLVGGVGVAAASLLCSQGICMHSPVVAQSAPAAGSDLITGLAILGDSTQDEYHADSARGGDFAATTYNWVELLATARGLPLGTWGTYNEPRRSGFAYNWARSGATSADMVSQGQLTGALQQIRSNEVSHAIIQIGINDFYFSGIGQQIYDGAFAGEAGAAELKALLDETTRNIFVTALLLQKFDTDRVILAAVQDYVTLPVIPELDVSYADATGQARLIDAFFYVNHQLATLSLAWGIPFFDYNAAMLDEINSRLDSEGYLVVGDERINLGQRGNDPRFGMLDDEYAHPGTVLSGLSANLFIEEMNRVFGTTIAPLSDAEILQAAGILP